MSLPLNDPLLRATEARRAQVEALKRDVPGFRLRERLGSLRPGGRLERPLRRGGAAGPLRLVWPIPAPGSAAQRDAVALTRLLEAGGVAAVAVATEPDATAPAPGWVDALRAATQLPLLLADLVVDEYQLLQAAVRGADGVLLAAAACSDVQLQVLVGQGRLLGLDSLVVVRDHDELKRALTAGATLVGLGDPAEPSRPADAATLLGLLALLPPLVAAIAWCDASAELARLRAGRCDAVRVGDALAESPDPAAALAELARAARG